MPPTDAYVRAHSPALLAAVALAAAAVLTAPAASALEPSELKQLYQAERDVRDVGGAMLLWSLDQSNDQPVPAATVDVTTVPVISRAALEAILVPTYTDQIPELDPWGTPYEYRFDPSWSGSGSYGGTRSAGANGTFEATAYAYGDTLAPSDDLLRWDGNFVRRLGPPFLPLIEAHYRALQEIALFWGAVSDWLTLQTSPVAPARLAGAVDLSLYEPIAAAELEALFFPYIPHVPEHDGWGQPWDYYLDPDPPFEVPLFAVRSRGRDGVAEGDVYTVGTFPALDFDRDVVMADGVDVQYPAGSDALIFVDDFERGDARFWSEWSP